MNILAAMLIAVLLILALSVSSAQVPKTINCQGYMTDSTGAPANGFFDVFFSLYSIEAGA